MVMTRKTPAEIGAEIKLYFPHFAAGPKFNKEFAVKDGGSSVYVAKRDGGSDMFNDFCQIGALLTDENRCLGHLSALSAALEEEVRNLVDARGLAPNRADPRVRLQPGQAAQLKATVVAKDTAETPAADQAFARQLTPKFYGALQRVLLRSEIQAGFNGNEAAPAPGDNPEPARGQVPTLTGFFHPDSFSANLLRQGYHWKDPGAGISHGEFSHRIQWWIIIREHQLGGPYKLRGTPLRRFQRCAKYASDYWVGDATAKGALPGFRQRWMWDVLCDCFTERAGEDFIGPRSSTFRCPETLNSFLKSAPNLAKDNLWMLCNYLLWRDAKRGYYEIRNKVTQFLDHLQTKPGITAARIQAAPGIVAGPADGKAVWVHRQ